MELLDISGRVLKNGDLLLNLRDPLRDLWDCWAFLFVQLNKPRKRYGKGWRWTALTRPKDMSRKKWALIKDNPFQRRHFYQVIATLGPPWTTDKS